MDCPRPLLFPVKFLLSLLAIWASTSLLPAQMPELVPVPPGDSLVERRLALVEANLGIKRSDWNLILPKDYAAKVTFRMAASEQPILEQTFEPGTTNPLFFASSPSPDDKEGLQITFGSRQGSANIYPPRPLAWKTAYGYPDGVKNFRLFEIFFPNARGSAGIWCEVSFQKR